MSANHSVNYSTIFFILLVVSILWLLISLGWVGYTVISATKAVAPTQAGGSPQQQVITTALQTLQTQTVEME